MKILKEMNLSERYSNESNQNLSPIGDPTDDKLVLLIVEDNDDVVQYLRSILAEQYQIEVAGNGLEGFEKAIEIIPDLVISDVMMPVMDGFAFCEKLKSDIRTSHIPIVMLTARADAESKIEGLAVGADAYLAKPFDQKELFVRIQKLIELRKSLQTRYKSFTPVPVPVEVSSDLTFDKEDTFIQEVRMTMEAHLSEEDFGISELCRSLAMSRSQLYRKFKALTNTTVNHFIFKIRLKKARELLFTTHLNITQVAIETGFKSVSHFSRLYSNEFGMSPSKARSN
jgi:DNA-binding response OmpR family regulator